MTLLVVGATGTLGRQVALHALEKGYKVRCLVRSYKRAAFLKEKGAELVPGDLSEPETLVPALEGVTAVIDAATARATEASIKEVDWFGKVALMQAARAAAVERFIFFSILNAEKFPHVPLMEIKRCNELFLAESGLNYTILRPCGFMQNLIGEYAIPILEKQAVYVTSQSAPVAYMDTQDIAKFAIRALELPETEKQAFPIVGTRAWSEDEIIRLCERLSGQEAKVTRLPLNFLRTVRQIARFFQWGWNLADRMAYAEVGASGQPMNAPMEEVYRVFGVNPEETTTLEAYMQEYFSRIMRRLKEIDYERNKGKKPQKKTQLWF